MLEIGKISKSSKALLSYLIDSALLSISNSDIENKFSTQIEIKNTEDKIIKEIKNNPYGIFNIQICENITDKNKDNFDFAIIIKNYNNEIKERKPINYIIKIRRNFLDYRFYQMSLRNGNLID